MRIFATIIILIQLSALYCIADYRFSFGLIHNKKPRISQEIKMDSRITDEYTVRTEVWCGIRESLTLEYIEVDVCPKHQIDSISKSRYKEADSVKSILDAIIK